MKSYDFKKRTHAVGKDQPEYDTLFAHIDSDNPETPFTFCMILDDKEIAELQRTRFLWIQQLTFGNKFQPIRMSTLPPEGFDAVIEPKVEKPKMGFEDFMKMYENVANQKSTLKEFYDLVQNGVLPFVPQLNLEFLDEMDHEEPIMQKSKC